jgi:hypothetical protein
MVAKHRTSLEPGNLKSKIENLKFKIQNIQEDLIENPKPK